MKSILYFSYELLNRAYKDVPCQLVTAQKRFQGKEGQPSLEEDSEGAPFFPLEEHKPSILSSRDQQPSSQEKHQQKSIFVGPCKRPTSQQSLFRLPLSRPLLVIVCMLILIAGGVPAAVYSLILMRSSSSDSPKVIDPGPIHSQPCSGHLMEYVVVHTTGGDRCFSGAESMPFSISGVIRIETNDNIASWIYEKGDKEQRDPENFDLRLHVCNHLAITYSPPVHLLRMFIASPLKKTRCTDNVTSGTVSVS